MAPHLEKPLHRLTGKLVDDIKRTWAVGSTGIVAQIQIIVFGEQLANAMQNGESAIAAIEDADGAWLSG